MNRNISGTFKSLYQLKVLSEENSKNESSSKYIKAVNFRISFLILLSFIFPRGFPYRYHFMSVVKL